MKKLFVGIDVSKDVFDYCFLTQENEVLVSKGQSSNTVKGIAEFCEQINTFKDYAILICMEHTGYYGSLLAFEFTKRGLCYSLLNPLELKLSMGLTRGKTDAIDAFRIASFALCNQHKLQPHKLPTEQLQQLKVLISMRDRYVKIVVQLKNGHRACQIVAKTIDIKKQLKESEALIKRQEKAILNLEKQMLELINSSTELKETFTKINQVIGVGPLTAIKCIVETDNFNKFNDGRKFSCHCGLAPFEYRSGSSVRGRTKTSPLRDKSLKSIFFKAACTAIQHDPQLKHYYSRKVQEGKHKLSVINAIANKIVLRIFAVAKRDEPFVKFSI